VSQLAARGVIHIYVDGGITIQRFLRAKLIQRLIITRVPVLIGSGITLFGALEHDVSLTHVATRQYASGLVQSEYVVAAGVRLRRWLGPEVGGAMNSSALYSSNAFFRVTLKSLAFVFSLSVAIFSASAGYGLLKVLIRAMSIGAGVGIAEFSTHSGLTVTFFVFAGLGAYLAKKLW
jgi:hypothetical protein